MPRRHRYLYNRKGEGCAICGGCDRLTYTECCSRLACKGCAWEHQRMTRCGYHSSERHGGDWKTCEECTAEGDCFEDSLYGISNSEEEEQEEEKACKICEEEIKPKNDYLKKGGDYYCIECYLIYLIKDTRDAETQTQEPRQPQSQAGPQKDESSNSQSNTKDEKSKTSKSKSGSQGESSDQKYGKRKAQGADDEQSNRSATSSTVKKVKKNGEENGTENKKMIEIISSGDKSDNLTPLKGESNDLVSSRKGEDGADDTSGKRSSSSSKKKVQANQKKV